MKFSSGIQQEKSGQFVLEHNNNTGSFTFFIREIKNSEGYITRQKKIGVIPQILVKEADDPRAMADLVQLMADQFRVAADKLDDRAWEDIDEVAKTYSTPTE